MNTDSGSASASNKSQDPHLHLDPEPDPHQFADTNQFGIYICLGYFVCVSQFVAECSAFLLVLIIKLTKERRRRVSEGGIRDREIGDGQIMEGVDRFSA
jgi:hypothetical protein